MNISPKKFAIFLFAFCIQFSCFHNSLHANESDNSVVILYPKVRQPYNKIFNAFVEGIESTDHYRFIKLELNKSVSKEDTMKFIQKNKAVGVIALGKKSIRYFRYYNEKSTQPLPAVAGASILEPSDQIDFHGISMAPEPFRLFELLKSSMPTVTKIHVVYPVKQYQWLIAKAQAAAKQLDIAFESYPTHSVHELASQYTEVLKTQKPQTEALWLPHSGKFENRLIQTVLEKSWARKLAVISSNAGDVQKGALFSVLPNNHVIGVKLADLLKGLIGGNHTEPLVSLTHEVYTAINIRTARHIGLSTKQKFLKQFKIIHPYKKR